MPVHRNESTPALFYSLSVYHPDRDMNRPTGCRHPINRRRGGHVGLNGNNLANLIHLFEKWSHHYDNCNTGRDDDSPEIFFFFSSSYTFVSPLYGWWLCCFKNNVAVWETGNRDTDYDNRRRWCAALRDAVAVITATVTRRSSPKELPFTRMELPLLLKMELIICSTPSTRGSSECRWV